MSRAKILHIGIASRKQMKARTLAIARGKHRPGADEPKVWFTSMEAVAQVLSSKSALFFATMRARKGDCR